MNTPALDIFEARKTAGLGGVLRSGISQAWKSDPANTLMAGATAAGAASNVAAPLVANMTAPGAPSRRRDQTNSVASSAGV